MLGRWVVTAHRPTAVPAGLRQPSVLVAGPRQGQVGPQTERQVLSIPRAGGDPPACGINISSPSQRAHPHHRGDRDSINIARLQHQHHTAFGSSASTGQLTQQTLGHDQHTMWAASDDATECPNRRVCQLRVTRRAQSDGERLGGEITICVGHLRRHGRGQLPTAAAGPDTSSTLLHRGPSPDRTAPQTPAAPSTVAGRVVPR